MLESPVIDSPKQKLKKTLTDGENPDEPQSSFEKKRASFANTSPVESGSHHQKRRLSINPLDHGKTPTITAAQDESNISSHRPQFPPNSPEIFQNPSITIISTKQLTHNEWQHIPGILKKNSVVVLPPKVQVRILGFKGEDLGYEESGKKKKVLDIHMDVQKFLDTDYLLYNPEEIQRFQSDTRHAHKSLKIYKYLASSKLKSLCSALKEQYVSHFDELDLRISNNDYLDLVPKIYTGIFFSEGCTPVFSWGMSVLFPILLPFLFYEYTQRKEYSCGFVYRIKKKSLELVQKEVEKILKEAVLQMESSSTPKPNDTQPKAIFNPANTVGQLDDDGKAMDGNFDVLKRIDQTSTV